MSGLFLRSVRLTDFRTFGAFETPIVPAPGLTLLVGANGLGKSSFFDALEWGLTGEVRRFKSFMKSAAQGSYLTRRGAKAGSHRVSLGFDDDTSIARGPKQKPEPEVVIELLKKPEWTAQIQDIATYLAFTHFLGQAAQQRFTSRDRNEQWESLKGPSGIDRLDEVRNGLRGKSTEMAFTRRIKDQTEAIEEAKRQLDTWRDLVARASRMRALADSAGGLPPEALTNRLGVLFAAVQGLAPDLQAGSSPEQQLSAIHRELETQRRNAASRRILLDGLADIPVRYAAEASVTDPDSPPLGAARTAEQEKAAALTAATAAVQLLRDRLAALGATITQHDRTIAALETARTDLEWVSRAGAEMVSLEADRVRLDGALALERAGLEGVDTAIAVIQTRVADLAQQVAAATGAMVLADLARQMPTLRERALASEAVSASIDSAAALLQLTTLTTERNRLAQELQGAQSTVNELRQRSTQIAAAVAAIASHLHDDDQDCPVCRSHFNPGQLRLVAAAAASAQDTVLAAAELSLADVSQRHDAAVRGIAATESLLNSAELAQTNAAADSGAVAALESQLLAGFLEPSEDIVASVLAAERQAAADLASAQATGQGDAAELAERTVRRNEVSRSIAELETELANLGNRRLVVEDDRRRALERLEAAGHQGGTVEALTATLDNERKARAIAENDRQIGEEALRMTIASEAAAQSEHQAAEEALRRLTSAQAAAAQAQSALLARWRSGGLGEPPDAVALETALEVVATSAQDIERLEDERSVLAAALDAAARDQELTGVLTQLNTVGGEVAAQDPARYESELASRCEAAQVALDLTQATHTAIHAFADKLRDEATKFSTQFLTPLNGLIGDFNEALLSTPGETVQLNAAYHRDRTQFGMGLHYRDPLDDATYDTGLPPQVVLSEGQLAANGFSILCAASTAYPWSRWRALLMDDPLQHNDIIHAAAFVDLMRNLVELKGYQLFMSSHDRAEAEFIRRKFDAAGLPCSVIALTAPSKGGVRYLPPDHNSAARAILADGLAHTA